MKQSVNESAFRDAFRSIRPDNFSYEGLGALFEYLEQLEDDLGEELELDVIALCCDYSEYTLAEINQDYLRDFESLDDAIEWLSDRTTIIPVNDDVIIIQNF